MKKFVEYSKMSKKQQKEENLKKRKVWTCSPITRVVPSKKIYSRKKVAAYED